MKNENAAKIILGLINLNIYDIYHVCFVSIYSFDNFVVAWVKSKLMGICFVFRDFIGLSLIFSLLKFLQFLGGQSSLELIPSLLNFSLRVILFVSQLNIILFNDLEV